MGCLIWNIQRGSIDGITEIVMVYNVLPSLNCLDMSTMLPRRVTGPSSLAWNEDFSMSDIELVPVQM